MTLALLSEAGLRSSFGAGVTDCGARCGVDVNSAAVQCRDTAPLAVSRLL